MSIAAEEDEWLVLSSGRFVLRLMAGSATFLKSGFPLITDESTQLQFSVFTVEERRTFQYRYAVIYRDYAISS